ncbi:uncharacterized protein BYT42DRAFT_586169 [Radiomyces spectabilis]|uniref:uncharacterized protein n=1 Tax=Radiomyces spectabilis TaxID=64574 RepID=UPI002220DBB8|nr:uncharacterized protein BYT42DRAFT_586169 [Radiomyces spectabilis]KAI8368324.1 hypothetical protein BYT42DRAFT_586169 [Radiomyces spectabilis]
MFKYLKVVVPICLPRLTRDTVFIKLPKVVWIMLLRCKNSFNWITALLLVLIQSVELCMNLVWVPLKRRRNR